MKLKLLSLLFIMYSCGTTHYVLHNKPEYTFFKTKEPNALVNKGGVTLTYDRSPWVQIEGEDSNGQVRVFYKAILTNLSDKKVTVAKSGIRLKYGKQEILAKLKKEDKKLLIKGVKSLEKLELEVVFDLNEKIIKKYSGKRDPLYLAVKLSNGDDLKMKVWLWSI